MHSVQAATPRRHQANSALHNNRPTCLFTTLRGGCPRSRWRAQERKASRTRPLWYSPSVGSQKSLEHMYERLQQSGPHLSTFHLTYIYASRSNVHCSECRQDAKGFGAAPSLRSKGFGAAGCAPSARVITAVVSFDCSGAETETAAGVDHAAHALLVNSTGLPGGLVDQHVDGRSTMPNHRAHRSWAKARVTAA
jgi:hypothetical protein